MIPFRSCYLLAQQERFDLASLDLLERLGGIIEIGQRPV